MRVNEISTRDAIEDERARRYLAAWPLMRQLEAHGEAAAGRPGRRDLMVRDFEAIRQALPYPPEA